MPALANIRRERFARAFIKTGSRPEAYRKAGFTTTNQGSIWTGSYRLFNNVQVQSRIKELKRQMAARNRVTVDSLLQDLADDRALARELGQPSAAIAATQLSAKLVGLLIDRKEAGAPGDFACLASADEVLALVKTELGEETAALLAAALARSTPDEPAEVVDEATRDESSTLQ